MYDVLLFAPTIGLDRDYRRDAKAKKDVMATPLEPSSQW